MTPPVAFYCVSSELYFPGAVGLVNSLRLVGHDEPIFVLDCGLTSEHRALVAREATLVPGPADQPPYTLKTIAPRLHPARTMVLIDVDMVVTRSLAPLIARAGRGGVVAFKDNLDRHCDSWAEALELPVGLRHPYVSSGLVVLGGTTGAEVLWLWDDRVGRVDYERSWFARDDRDYEFRFLDQDVLNAILCGVAGADELEVVASRLAPHQPYRGLRLVDEARLRCEYADRTQPYVLHQYLKKPWLEPMYHGIYSRLLSRLWLGADVPVALPEAEVPLRMRGGLRARLHRKRVDAADLVRWYARDVIPEWIAARRAPARKEAEREP